MAYVVTAVYELDGLAYNEVLLGIVNTNTEAFRLVSNSYDSIKKEVESHISDGFSFIWSDHIRKEFGIDFHTKQAFYSEIVYTEDMSEMCASITFTIYEVKGQLAKE